MPSMYRTRENVCAALPVAMDPGQLLLPLFYSCGTPVSTRNAALGVKPLQG
jgi:hypothetical protein